MDMKQLLALSLVFALLTACGPAPVEFQGVPDTVTYDLIPKLTMPPGAQQAGGGGGGGDNASGIAMGFLSELSPEEVHQHYADQLTAAGWRFISQEVREDGLISFWELTDADGAVWPGRCEVTLAGPDLPDLFTVEVMVVQPR
jgi:hypothetical protein